VLALREPAGCVSPGLHRWPQIRDRLRGPDPAYEIAFAQEVRRFYPFAPFVGGRAVTDLTWRGTPIPAGSLVLLDIFGQDHDAALWPRPYDFAPDRFLDRPPGRDELIPQGGGDPHTNHRCPGEDAAVALLALLGSRLANLEYEVPPQDLTIPLGRIPTLPAAASSSPHGGRRFRPCRNGWRYGHEDGSTGRTIAPASPATPRRPASGCSGCGPVLAGLASEVWTPRGRGARRS